MKNVKSKVIVILLICFLFGLLNRVVSEVLYHSLSDENYRQWFYNLIYLELLVYSIALTIYAFLFKLCTITKIGIITSIFLTFLDLLSVSIDINFKIVDKYSIVIVVLSFIMICVEFLYKKLI